MLAALAVLLPGSAQAHAVSSSLGDFYGGGLHLLGSPEHLLTVLGLGMLLGAGGREIAREPLLLPALPLALAAGAASAGLAPAAAWAGTLSLLLLGGALAASTRPPRPVLAVAVALLGIACGLANGAAMTPTTDRLLFAPGVAIAGFLVAFHGMLLARAARPFWARVAVRVAGSWIAATGILVLGMHR